MTAANVLQRFWSLLVFRDRRSLPVAMTLLSLLLAADASGDDPAVPCYQVRRAACPIAVDGCLSESAWRTTSEVGPFTFAWYKSGKQEQTHARLLWDDLYLYAALLLPRRARLGQAHPPRPAGLS